MQLLPLTLLKMLNLAHSARWLADWGDTSPGKPQKYFWKGDSGRPLICAAQYCGIVSFGEECENTSIPGVY
ncbi:hypothetical protein Nmel_008001, partial [Mimus melanotis]